MNDEPRTMRNIRVFCVSALTVMIFGGLLSLPAAAQSEYAISGHIAASGGAPVPDVTISADGDGGTDVTDASGAYSIIVPAEWFGTVTPASTAWVFDPPNRDYTTITQNLTGQDYVASPRPHLISGTIQTANGAAITSVVVSGSNGASSTMTSETGYYELAVPYGWAGRVAPSRAQYLFVPEYTDYPAVTEDQTDQDYIGEATVPGDVWNDYIVLYKRDGAPTSPTLTTTGLFILSGGEGDTLSIKKKRGIANAAPIGFLRSNGSFVKVYTEGAIGEMLVGGAVQSLTAQGCYVQNLTASCVGAIKMTWEGQDEVYTSISTASIFGLKAGISLYGVVLQRLFAPQQDVASVKVFAKKHTVKNGKGKVSFVSAARIGGLESDPGVEVVTARSIGRIETHGGEIIPEAIQAALSKVSAKGIVFSVRDATETSFEEHPGDIAMAKLRSTGADLTVTSVGGDVALDELVADGRITKLSSACTRYIDSGTAQYMGGHLGTGGAPSSMLVAAGVNPAMAADIGQIYGALGVSGRFMAGADFAAMPEGQDDATTPTCRGNIISVSSKAPSPRLPEDPVIEGEAFVLDRTKLQTKLDKLPNAADFTVYDAAHPKF